MTVTTDPEYLSEQFDLAPIHTRLRMAITEETGSWPDRYKPSADDIARAAEALEAKSPPVATTFGEVHYGPVVPPETIIILDTTLPEARVRFMQPDQIVRTDPDVGDIVERFDGTNTHADLWNISGWSPEDITAMGYLPTVLITERSTVGPFPLIAMPSPDILAAARGDFGDLQFFEDEPTP